MLEYQLIRSKRRKTLVLQVKYGQITVRAPHRLASTFIDDFVREKTTWLRLKLAEQQGEVGFCDFSQGSSLFLLGEEVSLNIFIEKQPKVFISDLSISQTEPTNGNTVTEKQLNVVISERVSHRLNDSSEKAMQVKKQLENYFKQEAVQLITERLEFISQKISLTPTNVKIRQYRSRWGSCNNRGEVSFNYLLMMAPLFVIDYVIVHELCHLAFLDHSQQFWNLIEKHSPDYKQAKNWLNSHQAQLQWKVQVA